ncbi:hypothetical protein AB6A40_008753 [Gnathostoma spinigerum]|uniref:ATP synthase subunit e, mitochondrial n=1 Tax=Gnathostoma spinigerum TaxID=75299 RepID=A0ABD6EV35_9BILA
MSAAVRGFIQNIVNYKRIIFNPYEHYGRANIFRAVIASYIGIYLAFRWNKKRKLKAAREAMVGEKNKVAAAALKDAGLA